MIYENWYGMFDRRGDLFAVEESKTLADLTVAELAKDKKSGIVLTVAPITILKGDILEFILNVLTEAKVQAYQNERDRIAEMVKENLKRKAEGKDSDGRT